MSEVEKPNSEKALESANRSQVVSVQPLSQPKTRFNRDRVALVIESRENNNGKLQSIKELVGKARDEGVDCGDVDLNINCIEYSKRSIYCKKQKKGCELPEKIFLYFIYFDENGLLHVNHLLYDNEGPIRQGQEVENCIDFMAMWAAEGIRSPDAPVTHPKIRSLREVNFENVVFSEKCYVSFVLLNKNLRFHTAKNGRYAIKFVVRDDTPFTYGENVSFFDGRDFLVDLSKFGVGNYSSGFYMINHLIKPEKVPKNDNCIEDCSDPELQSESKCDWTQDFRFDIFVDVLFAVGGKGSAEKTIVIDPTGQNQGPPPGNGGGG